MSSGWLRTGLLCVVLLSASCGDDTGVNTRDTISPAAIVDLQARTIIEGSINVVWTAPGDDSLTGRASRYAIRLASDPITPETWDSASHLTGVPEPKQSGRIDAFTITDLMPDRYFFIAVRVADEANNWSGLSNVAFAYSTPGVDPGSPAMITDLSVIDSTETSVTLSWTAVGDDSVYGRASRYEVRYDTVAIDSISWENASGVSGVPLPSLPGVADNVTVGELHDSTIYYFGIKAIDDVGKNGKLSNIVQTSTMLSSDSIPPATVTDLEVIANTSTSATLLWTTPGDDGNSGLAEAMDIRYHSVTITEDNWNSAAVFDHARNPKQPGTIDTITITGIDPQTTHYYAIRYSDDRPNWSGLSNVVFSEFEALVWTKAFGGPASDVARRVVASSDGGFVVGGWTQSFGAGESDFLLAKFDDTGGVVWQRTFGTSAREKAYGLVGATNGGYLMVGTSNAISQGRLDVYIVKTDAEGNLEWETTWVRPTNDYAMGVCNGLNGGYVFTGHTSNSSPSRGRAFTVHIDDAGTMIWERNSAVNRHSMDITQTADGYYAIAGYVYYDWHDPREDGDVQAWFATFSSSGSWVLENSFGVYYPMGPAEMFLAVISSGDGGLVLSGGYYDYGNGYSIRVDAGGSAVWEKSPLAKTYGLASISDSHYLAVGQRNASRANIEVSTTDGVSVWEMSLAYNSILYSVCITTDGQAVAVGYTDSFGDSRDIYIVKLRP